MATRSHPRQPTQKQEAANEKTPQARLRELAGKSTELARIVAKNSNADTELLRELAASTDDLTRKEVASNPNTPTEILWKLGEEFPEELLNNSVFSLLKLENINFFVDIPHETLCSLLQHHAVPESFLEKATDNPDWEVQLAVATNSRTPKRILEKLVKHRSSDVCEIAKLHVNWVGEISEDWHEIAKAAMKTTSLRYDQNHEDEESLWIVGAIQFCEACLPLLNRDVGLRLAKNHNTPAYLLQLLAKADANYKIFKAIVENPNVTVNLLEQLLGDRENHIRQLVIYHPDVSLSVLQEFYTQLKTATLLETSAPVLTKLAQSRWKIIRKTVAHHINTPNKIKVELQGVNREDKDETNNLFEPDDIVEEWDELGKTDNEEKLWQELATMPNLSTKILDKLLINEDYVVRKTIAENLSTPARILEKLVVDDCFSARMNVAANPNIPMSLMQKLTTCKDDLVSAGLAKNPNTPASILEQLATDKAKFVRRKVAQHQNTSVKVLVQLAKDEDEWVRAHIAAHPHTPATILEQLAKDENEWVRAHIAAHPHTLATILEQLANDKHSSVRQVIAMRPDTSTSTLIQLAEDKSDSVREHVALHANTPTQTLEKLAVYEDYFVRQAVAKHPHTSINTLTQLATDKECFVRKVVAINFNTPTSVLQKLAKDEYRFVRDAALENFCQSIIFDRNTPATTLQQVAEIKDWRVSLSIARHPNTPATVLENLAKHQIWKVRLVVAKNLNTPETAISQLVEDKDKKIREAAIANPNLPQNIQIQLEPLNNPNTPANQLVELASSQWLAIRERVAFHPSIPTNVLEKLVQDNNSAVRLAVAQNPRTPANILEKLVEDKEIAIAVAANPNTPVTLLEELAQQKIQPLQEAAVRNLFSQYPDKVVPFLEGYLKSAKPSFTRLLVLLNPHAPSAFLAKNFRSSAWLERYAIAQNPNTPINTLKHLTQDGNSVVRAAAKANLQQRS